MSLGSVLANLYNRVTDPDYVPLDERPILEANPEPWDLTPYAGEENEFQFVNFSHILKTGEIPSFAVNGPYTQNQHIDWKSDDSFTRTMAQLKQTVIDRVEKENLATLPGREEWEAKVSAIVSEEVQKTPAFDTYRTKDQTAPNIKDLTRLNDLSEDIDNGTHTIGFDCKEMSIVEGALLQQTESHFNRIDKKDYYYAGGRMSTDSSDPARGHAFIISAATGNIIESTISIDHKTAYIETPYRFEEFVNGATGVGSDDSVYIAGNREDLHNADNRALEARLEASALTAEFYSGAMASPSLTEIALQFESLPREQQNQIVDAATNMGRDGGTYRSFEDLLPHRPVTPTSSILDLLRTPSAKLRELQENLLADNPTFPATMKYLGTEMPLLGILSIPGGYDNVRQAYKDDPSALETLDQYKRLQDIRMVRAEHELRESMRNIAPATPSSASVMTSAPATAP